MIRTAWETWKHATKALIGSILVVFVDTIKMSHAAAAERMLAGTPTVRELWDAGWVVFVYDVSMDEFVGYSDRATGAPRIYAFCAGHVDGNHSWSEVSYRRCKTYEGMNVKLVQPSELRRIGARFVVKMKAVA